MPTSRSTCFATGWTGVRVGRSTCGRTHTDTARMRQWPYVARRMTRCTATGELVRMTPAELEAVYTKGKVFGVPDGEFRGTPIVMPGTPFAPALTAILQATLWSGKRCDADKGRLVNKWGPGGLIRAIPADLRITPSWMGCGGECAEIDYSQTMPWPASTIRDEFRLIAPGRYLGIVYIGRTVVAYFALESIS